MAKPGTLKKTVAGEITTTSFEVTLNGGFARESTKKSSNSGLGFLFNLPRWWFSTCSHTKMIQEFDMNHFHMTFKGTSL